ncbi:beta-galactosidase [Staphylococcus nepalensis]|uniref:glycoside hydrolase family 35 protein n=1 Tax=Staphylococcus nepalensis TaxID=214473 RepID=UPI001A9993B3|nr:beta-galactosidase family protein [Staphylococcus nepalensis]MBO1217454.1 beta-galactosidase [Staphylococcus nepalensis]
MSRFKISETFYLDEQPFQILSGAIHYFRIPADDWYHSLYNLKALGFNTIETYIPWNFHEVIENEYDFTGNKDVKRFIKIAGEIGLYVIVRPSPYICAEWEFGGLPAWLLNYRYMRIRSSDEEFITKVAKYYEELFKILTPLQIDKNGPIIMMQIENEYGSYGEDKEYLSKLKELMMHYGVTVPLFTSDGAWNQCLRAGNMINQNVLVTGNFGSRTNKNFNNLKIFHNEYSKKWPLMCMEFWDGWFNRWGDNIIKRDSDDLVNEVKAAIKQGHINLYMFHGGTNFGFWNGCSARGNTDLPQITSYDYDAPLDEPGNPGKKYFKLQDMLKKEKRDIQQYNPKYREFMEINNIEISEQVSLFEILDDISIKTTSKYPQTMEQAGDGYGYFVYRTSIKKEGNTENLRIVDARDRVHLFIDNKLEYVAYQDEIGEKFEVQLQSEQPLVDILVENMGRVNYGHKLLSNTQCKGLGQGLMHDLHFVQDYEQFDIQFAKLKSEHFQKNYKKGTPSFHRFKFNLEETHDTYLDMQHFGKGIVLVNGYNIGRYWEIGPTLSLYISKSLLNIGENEIIIFETENKEISIINLKKKPITIDNKTYK